MADSIQFGMDSYQRPSLFERQRDAFVQRVARALRKLGPDLESYLDRSFDYVAEGKHLPKALQEKHREKRLAFAKKSGSIMDRVRSAINIFGLDEAEKFANVAIDYVEQGHHLTDTSHEAYKKQKASREARQNPASWREDALVLSTKIAPSKKAPPTGIAAYRAQPPQNSENSSPSPLAPLPSHTDYSVQAAHSAEGMMITSKAAQSYPRPVISPPIASGGVTSLDMVA